MCCSIWFISVISLIGAYVGAAPQAKGNFTEDPATSGSTIAITSPTSPYGVLSARFGSPIHLLSMQARGFNFYLGGWPATYCPQAVVRNCPSGEDTIYSGLGGLYVRVPGGQLIYARTDGSIGYTQAHSASVPEGGMIGGDFTYSKPEGAEFGFLGTNAFGAKGFMACPTQDQGYQVFASISNTTAPEGDLAACLGFNALTVDANDLGNGAWQYI